MHPAHNSTTTLSTDDSNCSPANSPPNFPPPVLQHRLLGPSNSSASSKVSNLEPNACDDLYASAKLNNLDLSLDTNKQDAYNKFDEHHNLAGNGSVGNPFLAYSPDDNNRTLDNNTTDDCDNSDNTGLLDSTNADSAVLLPGNNLCDSHNISIASSNSGDAANETEILDISLQ